MGLKKANTENKAKSEKPAAEKKIVEKSAAESSAEALAEPTKKTEEPAKKPVAKRKTPAKKKVESGPKFPHKAVTVMNPGNFKLSCSETKRIYKPNEVVPLSKEECNVWVRGQLDAGTLVER